MLKILIVVISFIVLIAEGSLTTTKVSAQDLQTSQPFSSPIQEATPISEVRPVEVSQLSGEVTKVSDGVITVNTSDGTKEITVPDNIVIKRNAMDANILDIKPGDTISVSVNQSGQVISIDAVAGSLADWAKLLPIIFVAGIVLALVIWWISRKTNKPHIKTTVS